jgi:NADP-dependent 3-hydroxy acid dehydrogenase YdfG
MATNDESVPNTNTNRIKGPKVWLVTGCSTGLGKCLVSAILARGDKVIATARKLSALEELNGLDHVKILSLDVTSPQSVLDSKVREACSLFGRVDVLVNNAGYVESGVWEELECAHL